MRCYTTIQQVIATGVVTHLLYLQHSWLTGIGYSWFFKSTGADPGYVKRGGRDPKGGAGWLI